ncbi:hypothetical protein, partial [Gluconobacter oxydans]
MSKTQLSFFDTSALGGGSNTLFWGDLPGDRAFDEAASLAKEAAAAPVVAPKIDFRLCGTRDLSQG